MDLIMKATCLYATLYSEQKTFGMPLVVHLHAGTFKLGSGDNRRVCISLNKMQIRHRAQNEKCSPRLWLRPKISPYSIHFNVYLRAGEINPEEAGRRRSRRQRSHLHSLAVCSFVCPECQLFYSQDGAIGSILNAAASLLLTPPLIGTHALVRSAHIATIHCPQKHTILCWNK